MFDCLTGREAQPPACLAKGWGGIGAAAGGAVRARGVRAVPAPATNWCVQPLFSTTAAAAVLVSSIPADSDLHWITYPHTRERKKQKLFKFQSHVRVRAKPTQASPWESGPVPAPLGEPLLGKQQLVNVSGGLGWWCGAWLAQGSQGACLSSLSSLPEASEAACQISQRRTRVTMF